MYNLVDIERTRRLSGQLPLTSIGEWCASVVNIQVGPVNGVQTPGEQSHQYYKQGGGKPGGAW